MIKNKGGRPLVVLTDEQVSEVEELAGYLTTEQIADYFGICRETFRAVCQRQPKVFGQYKKGKVKKILKFVQKLEDKAMGVANSKAIIGDSACLIFYLKTQAGWSEKQLIEKKIQPNKDVVSIRKSE